jgi:hypothetical protein
VLTVVVWYFLVAQARKQYLSRQKTNIEENITELLAQATTGN